MRSVLPISMFGGLQADHSGGSGMVHRHPLNITAKVIPLLGGDYGSPLQKNALLEAVEQP